MGRRFSVLVGITLVLMGAVALVFNVVMPTMGWGVWRWGAWRLWPLFVVAAGLFFVLSPLLASGHRGLGALFIPGAPILTAGGILLYVSLFDIWEAWEWLWPLEVLSLAVGFLLAAIYARTIWLVVPAIIVGANGLALQFCALTGLWESWTVLWTVEPLSVGLSCLVVSVARRSAGFFVTGLLISGLAGMGLIGMTAIFPWWWPVNLLGPVVIILVGFLLLIWGVVRRPPSPSPAGE